MTKLSATVIIVLVTGWLLSCQPKFVFGKDVGSPSSEILTDIGADNELEDFNDYVITAYDVSFGIDGIPGSFWGDSRQSPFSKKTGKIHPEPEFVGISSWINSQPVSLDKLRGNVVLVEFWTYSCMNCVWSLPHLNDWYDNYTDQGLVIIGVHSPEMRAEKKQYNVLAAVTEHQIRYPVALDNDFATWRAFGAVAWPTVYLVDRRGVIRYSLFGSGHYDKIETAFLQLLAEGNQGR